MADHKITDFVDQSAIDGLQNLKREMKEVKEMYVEVANELLKTLKIRVEGLDGLDKMYSNIVELQNRAAEATQRHAAALETQNRIVGNTTNTIARELMEQERVNAANREAYTGYEAVKQSVGNLSKGYEQMVISLNKLDQNLRQVKAGLKANEEAYQNGQKSQEDYERTLVSLTRNMRNMQQERSTLVAEMKREEKAAQAGEQSYVQMSQRLEQMKTAYKMMSAAERESAEGQELVTHIQELDAHLKDVAASMGEHQRNVGNYAIAGESVKKSLKELVLQIATLTVEYNGLSEEEKNSAEGKALASHIQELTEKAGKLKDAISDTNEAISNAASDTRGIDQLSGGLKLAIDGFGLATGAAEMLGISSEDLVSVQTKLQAAIAASNAVQSIQNALQSQSAVMQAVNLAQTKLRTTAENLHTAAQGKGVIATGALTAAQWAFNAAANANPIGLLVVAIVAAAGAVWGLVKAFQAITGPSKEALRQYEEQRKALDELCDANDRLIDRMKARGATESELLNQSLKNKQLEHEKASELMDKAEELYKKDSDEYKDAVEAKKKADEEFEQSKEDSLNYLLKVISDSEEEEKKQRLGTYEYKRQLIQAELEQQKALAAMLLDQEKITKEVYENLCASLDKAAQMKVEAVNEEETKSKTKTTRGSRASTVKSEIDDLKKAVEDGEDAMLKIIDDSLDRQLKSEKLSYDRSLKALQDKLAKTKESEVKMRIAINRQIEGLTAEHQRRMLELEMSLMERRNNAAASLIESRLNTVDQGSAEELKLKQKQLQNESNAEAIQIAKLEREKTLTTEQAEEMRANLVDKYAKKNHDLLEEYAAARASQIQNEYSVEQIEADNAYNRQVERLRQRYAEELKAAGNNEKKREEITREHEERVARLTETYAKQKAQASIDMIEETLKVENLSVEERVKLENELAAAKIALEKSVTDAVIAESQRQVDADKRATEKRIESAQRWLGVASDALGEINDLVSTIYDAKIEKIEKEDEANTESAEKEKDRISELVSKKVISEEEGEARMRAAEAVSAKKHEEMEKKKQEMAYKQAVWAKANNVAQIGLSTALAIMNAMTVQPLVPLGYAMAGIAATMGAIQLATALATPIPKYAKGTDDHPGGLAVVGDGGRQEIVSFGGKLYLTPDTPTLIEMPKGAEVYPDASRFMVDMLDTAPLAKYSEKPQVIVNNDYKSLERKMDDFIHVLKTQGREQKRAAARAEFEMFKLSRGL